MRAKTTFIHLRSIFSSHFGSQRMETEKYVRMPNGLF
jgi:hypothetical protein